MVQQQNVKNTAGTQEDAPATQLVKEQAAVQTGIRPHYPAWPTSKPGPRSTLPPPGMKPVNAIRREQVMEINYNQETGKPAEESPFRSQPDENLTGSTSFDQAETAQEALKRRKKRL
ncbi:MAG: hypothetical protein IMW89_00180 [Ktedonobacteraceae bacterium]|nr:hypothetical protein [Ktedonobacteraceae bacterium]